MVGSDGGGEGGGDGGGECGGVSHLHHFHGPCLFCLPPPPTTSSELLRVY